MKGHTMKILASAIAAIIFAATPANAMFKSGNDVLRYCASTEDSDQITCLEYIRGVADGLESQASTNTMFGLKNFKLVCFHEGIRSSQLEDVAVAYLQRNPAMRDEDAAGLLTIAWSNAWPCR